MTSDRADALSRATSAAIWWRGAGLVGGKGIAVLRSLLLARVLAPSDFGLYAIAFVALDLLLGVTDLGMTPALVQRADVEANDYDVAWTVGFTRGLAIGLIMFLAAPLFALVFGDPRATDVVRAIAFRPIITSAASIKVAELERNLRYRELALIELTNALSGTILALLLAADAGVWALVAGNLLGALFGALASYLLAAYRPRIAFDRGRADSLLRFGRWVLVGGIVAMIGEGALRATISHMLGTEALGRYALAATLAAAPGGLVGSAIGAVAFSLHARVQHDPTRAAEAYRSSLLTMATVLLPTYAVLYALAPSLVTIVLGANWVGTASVIRLLAAVGLLGLVFDATVALLQGRGQPRAVAALQGLFAICAVTLTWLLVKRYGLDGAGFARLAGELAIVSACVIFARRLLPAPFHGVVRTTLVIGVAAAVAGFVAVGLVRLTPTAFGVATAALAGLAAAAALLAGAERLMGLGLARHLPRVGALVRPASVESSA